MNGYKYEIKPNETGGYKFNVWTPSGILLDYPINLIPLWVNLGPVIKGSYFSGISQTEGGAMHAIRALVKAHKNYGFKEVDTNGLTASGVI